MSLGQTKPPGRALRADSKSPTACLVRTRNFNAALRPGRRYRRGPRSGDPRLPCRQSAGLRGAFEIFGRLPHRMQRGARRHHVIDLADTHVRRRLIGRTGCNVALNLSTASACRCARSWRGGRRRTPVLIEDRAVGRHVGLTPPSQGPRSPGWTPASPTRRLCDSARWLPRPIITYRC